MLVERSIDGGEGDGFGCIAVGGFVHGRFERERVQSEPCPFLGEQDVVEVAEQLTESLVGLRSRPAAGVVRPGVALSRLRLAPAGDLHPLGAAVVADLDLGEARSQFAAKAVDAQALGALGDFEQDQSAAMLVAAGAVPGDVELGSFWLMGSVSHLRKSTSRLAEIEDEVYLSIDRMCLRVGELLAEARELDPAGFKKWVETRLPFGFDKARRLIAIHYAYRELPPEKLAQLPLPWQALYALAPFAQGKLMDALESGEVGPGMTQREAFTKARHWTSNQRLVDPLEARYSIADTRAGVLMEHEARDLNPYVRDALRRWLERGSTDAGDGPVSAG